ncbi:DsbA family protein [Crystallibacter degradans]|uniref:DsbA family protein n=1 Tax=Crystallibacter degradans TaxID=2726743 RepID=UPI0014750683|nr:thioredoxin domain-containing protein [Arthrobacter sp. SF27]NMR28708.1 DsbA family protein [Arthrobacter sp. SF27]
MPSPKPTAPASNPRNRNFTVTATVLGVAVLLLFVGIFAYQGGKSQQAASAGQGEQAGENAQRGSEGELDMSRRIADDPTALGAVDAPVVMVEYSDYRCPFCGLFARDTLPALVKKYVDSGDLRIEWRDLPVFGEESMEAALAGRAAGEQGKFWEFNKAVYDAAPERGHADLNRERLIEFAEQSGVPDMKKFEADLESKQLRQAVTRDAQEAASLGATGTPTFLVNDTPFVGAQPLEAFEQAIDAELNEARSK